MPVYSIGRDVFIDAMEEMLFKKPLPTGTHRSAHEAFRYRGYRTTLVSLPVAFAAQSFRIVLASWWQHQGSGFLFEREDLYQHEVDTGNLRHNEVDPWFPPIRDQEAVVTERVRPA